MESRLRTLDKNNEADIIICMLQMTQKRTRANIKKEMGIDMGTVHKHIKRLGEQGLLTQEKNGREQIITPTRQLYNISILLQQMKNIADSPEEPRCENESPYPCLGENYTSS